MHRLPKRLACRLKDPPRRGGATGTMAAVYRYESAAAAAAQHGQQS
jgi:hypothetical protein